MWSWNKTITIYNKYTNQTKGEVTWHRHIIHNCFVKEDKQRILSGNQVLRINDYIIRIPEQPNYLPMAEWNNLVTEDMNNYLTLQPDDVVFLGEVNEDVNELVKGSRMSDIMNKYKDYGFTSIYSVNINCDLPPHHYHLKGSS